MDDYKKIVTYIDTFHRDIHALIVLIEKLMLERGYVVLPPMGNRVSWGLSAHFDRPDNWRIPFPFRIYMPEEAETFEQTSFFMINLEAETAFDFPPMLCGRLLHPPLTENKVWSNAFLTGAVKSLTSKRPAWQNYAIDRGWTIAEPAHKTLATGIKVYLLNLFDLQNQTAVLENVIVPLTEDPDLDMVLTILRHPVPGTGD